MRPNPVDQANQKVKSGVFNFRRACVILCVLSTIQLQRAEINAEDLVDV
jgi:hypothetical protein